MAGKKLPDSVAKCIDVLKCAGNDSDKLSALFLATNIVKSDQCDDEVKRLLYDLVGVDFLKRLLTSADSFSACPPPICRSLAMSMFTTFTTVPDLAKKKPMLSLIINFLDTIFEVDEDEELMVVSDAYDCLKRLSLFAEGQEAMIKDGGADKLILLYTQQYFQSDEALNILVSLSQYKGANLWEKHDLNFVNTFINKLATDFITDHERKYELCTALYHIIESAQRSGLIDKNIEESWHFLIFKGINEILSEKLNKTLREPALHLAAVMVRILGTIWTIQDSEKPKQFYLLLTQLCSIEVRMQLDNREVNQVLPNSKIILSSFAIIESSVTFMSNELVDLDSKEKQQIYTSLKGAFTAIVNTLQKFQAKNAKEKLNECENDFTVALIRVLAVWMCQETSSMRPALHEALPFILSITNDSFYTYRIKYVAQKVKSQQNNGVGHETHNDEIDLLKLMLPALCHFTVEDKGRQIMMECKEEEVLLECFSFHWSIVNYKKPIVPKSERLKMKNVKTELPLSVKEAIVESRAALINMCNIFMNIIVLDSKFVETSSTFHSLLKLVLDNLTELKNVPENLVLHSNMAVLGLLLLRHQSQKVSKTDFSICRFMQTTIRFLWDAYTVDESNHMAGLDVSMAYKRYWLEVMEMWFLGMQTMSVVLSLIPWISEFIMETGWAQGTLDTLKKARPGSMPHNTKAAYEDLLCQLVKTNSSVIPVFKEHHALTVCRNHMLLELGKLLFGD